MFQFIQSGSLNFPPVIISLQTRSFKKYIYRPIQSQKMQVISTKVCPKHNVQARFMCTRLACFQDESILVCQQCISKHSAHQSELIQTTQLNQKVHELMKKRMQFEQGFERACDALIVELKKFKLFKLEVMNMLNYKERYLNQLCKKIRRNIPYEKDKNLFKKSLNYVYLAMRGINPNFDLHKKFQLTVKETINQCRKALYKLQINSSTVPLFEKKDQQMVALLKRTSQQPIDQIKYHQPTFKQFKKETLKFSKQQQEIQADSRMFRLSDQEFLAYNSKCHYVKWYNTQCFLLPRSMYIGQGIEHLTVLGKNVFLTEKGGYMAIYDLLNQKIVKEYASSNHKSAQICSVLTVNHETLLNFVTSPNQIVTLKYNDETQQLKMVKGIETNAKCTGSLLMGDQFVASFQDRTIGIYKTEQLEVQHMIPLNSIVKCMTSIDHNTLVCGTEQSKMFLIDKRTSIPSLTIPTTEQIYDIKKIYPSSILYSHGKSLKIFDLKMQKELFSSKVDQTATSLQILNSNTFVASGKNLHLWKGVS